MSNYDPEWSFEEAQEANEREMAATGKQFCDPTLPFSRLVAHHELVALGEQFKKGDQWVLMQAIRVCANHDMPLPEWASRAYIRAYDSVNWARAKSWDEVFGRPYPKGTNMKATRKRRIGTFQVWNRVREIQRQEPDTPISEALFERVGKEFNLGKTLASEYYYIAKRRFGF